ncbi:FG-GAP-like repeat-containing protein [Archangium primigenium]|uniref:FG-GAP-like repeat-containing protein n=1 Tax=[Archangium] primigenium TaxID=2792470 RepID=UPI00195C82D0|nr:FG-GAP-like repeat-containing protein [Archangium primigenium]MBM7119074.1 VCBS repeat-containing protein [Archangium primigenium]
MNPALRASLVFALLSSACTPEGGDDLPLEGGVGFCDSLSPLTLTTDASRIRVNQSLLLKASGGSGSYRYRIEPGGSSGQLNGSNFVAGATPATDTLVVEDQRCPGDARVQVEVIAAFGVAPARATLKPGTSFQVEVRGLLGPPVFTLRDSQAGSGITESGLYTAGAKEGLDLIEVRDGLKGDLVELRFEVKADAELRGDPAFLALPSGSSAPLGAVGGSDQVRWTKVSGPGEVVAGRFSVGAQEEGTAVLEGWDRFTQQRTNMSVRVLKDLGHPTQAHGQLTDLSSIVTGDFDGDGLMDVAVGRPESDLSRPQGGAVFIYKGSTAGLPSQPTWTLTGDSDAARFGDTVLAGDLDGDGRPDLAVAAPGASLTITNSGAVFLYRFGDKGPEPLGAPLSNTGRGAFGTGLALADVDGDKDLDVVVGSPAGDLAPTSTLSARGIIDVYLLAHGQPVPAQANFRMGGINLTQEGKFEARRSTDLGRAVAVGDLNGDGRPDMAALSKLWRYDTGNTDKLQQAVAVYFGRADGSPLRSSPDLFITPSVLTDTNEGNWKLAVLPAEGSRPTVLAVLADRSDSPDLRTRGGLQALSDAGVVLLFDLSTHTFKGDPSDAPPQIKRDAAWAQLYGDTAGGVGGRGWTVMDVDGTPGAELLMGIPYFSPTTPLRMAGKVIVHPLATLKKGDALNKPLMVLQGLERSDTYGVGLAAWPLKDGAGTELPGLVVLAARASAMDQGLAFTGRLDAFTKAGETLDKWNRTSTMLPARPSVERYGEVVAVAQGTKSAVALVGSPGWAGSGVNGDGNDLNVGRAWAVALNDAVGALVDEGASSPLWRGRNVGTDVDFSDFNGDGRPDTVVGAPGFTGPGTNARNTEITPYYAKEDASCLLAGNQGSGGVLVALGQADGSFKPAYRLWGQGDISGCTPAGATCQRRSIGRAVVGGFDFNGDGKEDIGALRNNGFELFLGRAPDDTSLAKLTMVCAPAYTSPYFAQQTSAPVAFGDLDGDGCDEVGWRYADGASSGIVILFGADATRCKRRAPVQLWLADKEAQGNFLGLGLSTTRAGRLQGSARPDFIATTATNFSYQGQTQQVVLLFSTARLKTELTAMEAASETKRVLKASDFIEDVLVSQSRAVGFGAVIRGGADLTGDGVDDLVVSAPNASIASDGGGAVFVFAGGPRTTGALSPWLTLTGDVTERANFGQSVNFVAAKKDAKGAILQPPALVVGAPLSYRTGTRNGAAFLVPLGF